MRRSVDFHISAGALALALALSLPASAQQPGSAPAPAPAPAPAQGGVANAQQGAAPENASIPPRDLPTIGTEIVIDSLSLEIAQMRIALALSPEQLARLSRLFAGDAITVTSGDAVGQDTPAAPADAAASASE